MLVATPLVPACGAGSVAPRLRDPQNVVGAYEVVARLDRFGLSETGAGFDRFPLVIKSSPNSRIVLLGFAAVPCRQSPVIVVHQAGDSIETQITPRQADPNVDCDAPSVGWAVELTLREALGDRTVVVLLASG